MKQNEKELRCGLIGEYLGHSFSPEIHRFLADYSYGLYEIKRGEVGEFMRSTDLTAFNVTIPYKKDVIPYLDEISAVAHRIGAVNTVTRTKTGGFRGDNTDYYGFLKMVEASGISVKNKKILVLGTGGASVTVHTVLSDLGARETVSVSRTGPCNYETVYLLHKDADVIVNTTPVGMYPNTGASPLRLTEFSNLSGVLDLIYNPGRTALLLEAEHLGLPYANGLLMLVAQAKRASELFLGGTEIADERIQFITREIRRKTENLVLVGMPGCGKSTAARLLSSLTGREAIDTDEAFISLSGGKTPAEYIREYGESAFRHIESEAVRAVGKLSGKIIATGGGVPTIRENYDALHQNGVILWLKRPLSSLSTEGRPLSQGQNLDALYEKRRPFYEAFADGSVDSCNDPMDTAEALLKKFEKLISL